MCSIWEERFVDFFYLQFKHQSNQVRLDGLLVVDEFVCTLRCNALVNIGMPSNLNFRMAQRVKIP